MTAQMDLASIMLSEISQSEKDKHHMISLIQYQGSNEQNKLTNKMETDWKQLSKEGGWGLGEKGEEIKQRKKTETQTTGW